MISITDGQILSETASSHQGIRPAINVGLSVSRVGPAAQLAAMKRMSGTLKPDLALYREMAAPSSLGPDESTQELLRRGAALTEMLKQQQFRPLPSEIQVSIPYNGARERITPKQIRFYEYQVVPNLIYGLGSVHAAKATFTMTPARRPINATTPPPVSLAITERACAAQSAHMRGESGTKRYALERDMALKADHSCTYLNLALRAQPKTSFIYNLSFPILKTRFKYGLLAYKTNKDVNIVPNTLPTSSTQKSCFFLDLRTPIVAPCSHLLLPSQEHLHFLVALCSPMGRLARGARSNVSF